MHTISLSLFFRSAPFSVLPCQNGNFSVTGGETSIRALTGRAPQEREHAAHSRSLAFLALAGPGVRSPGTDRSRGTDGVCGSLAAGHR